MAPVCSHKSGIDVLAQIWVQVSFYKVFKKNKNFLQLKMLPIKAFGKYQKIIRTKKVLNSTAPRVTPLFTFGHVYFYLCSVPIILKILGYHLDPAVFNEH